MLKKTYIVPSTNATSAICRNVMWPSAIAATRLAMSDDAHDVAGDHHRLARDAVGDDARRRSRTAPTGGCARTRRFPPSRANASPRGRAADTRFPSTRSRSSRAPARLEQDEVSVALAERPRRGVDDAGAAQLMISVAGRRDARIGSRAGRARRGEADVRRAEPHAARKTLKSPLTVLPRTTSVGPPPSSAGVAPERDLGGEVAGDGAGVDVEVRAGARRRSRCRRRRDCTVDVPFARGRDAHVARDGLPVTSPPTDVAD